MSAELPRPIIILGSPRSGTSLTAGLFAVHGVWTGVCRSADKHNPRGYFENIRLNNMRLDGDLSPDAVRGVLEAEGWTGGAWLVKHSPIAWRCWLPFRPRFVLCRRRRDNIIASHRRRGTKVFEERLVKHQQQMAEIEAQHGGQSFWPGQVVRGRLGMLSRLLRKCAGVKMDREAVAGFVDRKLWH